MSVDRLHALLSDFRSRHAVPAVGAAVVSPDEVVLHVVGARVRGGDAQVERDDQWHLGSCGKSITALLYARLVEAGDARWGASLPALFPDLEGTMHPAWSTITIDDLFVSQAGLPANLRRAEMKRALTDAGPPREQRTLVAADALARTPRRPGRFLYSNLGYVVIGAAIERITGLAYEQALDASVLVPLGLTTGGFGPPPALWGHGGLMLALGPLGIVDLGRGKPADPANPASDNPAVLSPAGRLHLALADWGRLHRVFLSAGDGFVQPETMARLLTTAPGDGQRQAFGWAPVSGFEGVSLGQQGSNTYWVATAMMDRDGQRTALVVCNAGRARLLTGSAKLAAALLADS